MILSAEEKARRKAAKARWRLPRIRGRYALSTLAMGLGLLSFALWWVFGGSHDVALMIRDVAGWS